MRSISLLGLFALLASLPLATKFQVAFSLVKALVTPGFAFAAGFRVAAVEIEEDLDEKAVAPAQQPEEAAPANRGKDERLNLDRLVEKTIRQKELDARMRLLEARPAGEQPDIEPFLIKIDEKGRVYAGSGEAQELLEANAEEGQLPKLAQRLEVYAAAARLGNQRPAVQIHVEGNAEQRRVLQVIDVLRKHGVGHVTFADLIDEEE